MRYDAALFISANSAGVAARKIATYYPLWTIMLKPHYERGAIKGYVLLCFEGMGSFILTEEMVERYGHK